MKFLYITLHTLLIQQILTENPLPATCAHALGVTVSNTDRALFSCNTARALTGWTDNKQVVKNKTISGGEKCHEDSQQLRVKVYKRR